MEQVCHLRGLDCVAIDHVLVAAANDDLNKGLEKYEKWKIKQMRT